MQKTAIALLITGAILGACAKHDPILPGDRTAVFSRAMPNILNTPIENLGTGEIKNDTPCPYTRDASNVIWHGTNKIFSGFPTSNSVDATHTPVCNGAYVYAGLTTGEVVKVNTKTRQIAWIADVYSASNMTGGSSILDIVAPVIVTEKSVYAGGLGDALCRLDMNTGAKKWCTEISVAAPMVIVGPALYAVGGDKNLYAVRRRDGAIFWRTPVKDTAAAEYNDGIITVGHQKFDAKTGNLVK